MFANEGIASAKQEEARPATQTDLMRVCVVLTRVLTAETYTEFCFINTGLLHAWYAGAAAVESARWVEF